MAKKTKKAKKETSTLNLNDFASNMNIEGVSKGQVLEVLKTFCSSVASTVENGELSAGDKINLPHVGSLLLVDKKARDARNPKTGEAVKVAARKGVKFRLSSNLRMYGKTK